MADASLAQAGLSGECARCLDPIRDEIVARFHELFVYADGRHDQSDEAGAPLAPAGGPFIPPHIKNDQNRLTRIGRDAGAVVEHPGHRGLADFGLLGDVRQSCAHGGMLAEIGADW